LRLTTDGHRASRGLSATAELLVATMRYDSVYLTCSKKLTGSQLRPPHGTNKKLKCETKIKPMRVIGPVQSRCHEGSTVGAVLNAYSPLTCVETPKCSPYICCFYTTVLYFKRLRLLK